MKKSGVILKKGKEAILQNRHMWIFSGAIQSYPENYEDGSICPIFSHDGHLLAHGYFHKKLSLAGRIISFGEKHPKEALFSSLDKAIALRESLIPNSTNAYRLVNAEGDFLPGLIIDQYADCLVLQSGTLGMDKLKKEVASYLAAKKKWTAIYEKSTGSSRKEEGLSSEISVLFGEEKQEILVEENGIKFKVLWKTGQKTGFFLDQREMRRLVFSLSKNKRVFNCFSYTGGFSLYAAKGGAKQVDSLDISKDALELAKENCKLNGFSLDKQNFFAEDAFNFLEKKELNYDLVILDPPAFAKKKKDVEAAIRGYRELNALTLSKMPKNSMLLTCSCSYYIENELFQKILFQSAKNAGREVKIIGTHVQAVDHPINIFHPEMHYLKSLLLYVT